MKTAPDTAEDAHDLKPLRLGHTNPKTGGLGPVALTPAVAPERKGGSSELGFKVGTLHPDGKEIYTQHPTKERLQGVANRNLIMPYFMKYVEEIDGMYNHNYPGRAKLVLGAPATGKTFNITAAARRHGDYEFVSCRGGMRSIDLIREISFVDDKGTSLQKRVDTLLEKINSGEMRQGGDQYEMDAATLQQLRKFGDAFKEETTEGGKVHYAVDWNALHNQIPRSGAKGEHTKDDCVDVLDVIKNFLAAQGESIEKGKMGVKYIDGPLIRAIKNKTPTVILDEFTRLEDFDALLTPLEVLMGQTASCTIKDAADNPILLERGKCPIVLMTGNTLQDEGIKKSIDSPILSRLATQKITAEMPENLRDRILNWQHVIENLMSGTSPTTLLTATLGDKQSHARQEADFWRHFFNEYVNFALTEEERKVMPAWQRTMRLNWENVQDASQHLAQAFVAIKECLNPDSPVYTQPLPANSDPTKQAEVNAQNLLRREIASTLRGLDPSQRTIVDFRTVAGLIQDALKIKNPVMGPEGHDFIFGEGGGHPVEPKAKVIEERFGRDLVTAIIDWRDESVLKPISDPRLRNGLKLLINDQLAQHRIVHHANNPSQDVSGLVEGILTIDPKKHRPLNEQAADLRAELVTEIKRKHGLDVPEEEISATAIADAMGRMNLQVKGANREHYAALETAPKRNYEPMDQTVASPMLTFHPNVLRAGATRDLSTPMVAVTRKLRGDTGNAPRADMESILKGLTLPHIAEKNFERLFSRDLSMKVKPPADNLDEIKVAENRSETGLAVTTLVCSDKAGHPARLHIVRNHRNNTTLIVGGAIDDTLKKDLENSGMGVTYVNRDQPGAVEKTMTTMRAIFEADSGVRDRIAFLRGAVLKALMLRNEIVLSNGAVFDPVLEAKTLAKMGTTGLLLNNGGLVKRPGKTADDRYAYDPESLFKEYEHLRDCTIRDKDPNIMIAKNIQL